MVKGHTLLEVSMNEKKYLGEWKNGKQNGQGTLHFS